MLGVSKLDYIGMLVQAMYKSGKLRIQYEEMPEILDNYFGEGVIPYPTVGKFLQACREFADGDSGHLVLGGRRSKNPVFILYGNNPRPKSWLKY